MNTHQNDPRVFHETIVRDIVDLIIDGAKNFDDVDAIQPFGKAKRSFRSITKASSNLILTFPVLISDSISIEEGIMISKSHERKCAAMMQMLFSALCVSDDDTNVYEYLKKFHTNLNFDDDDVSVDNFIDTMDSVYDRMDESGHVLSNTAQFKQEAYNLLIEDMRNLNYTLPNSYINESSINDYTVYSGRGKNGSYQILAPITEAKNKNYTKGGTNFNIKGNNYAKGASSDSHDTNIGQINNFSGGNGSFKMTQEKINISRKENDKWGSFKDRQQGLAASYEKFSKQMVSNDMRKANELVPTMMVVNFFSPGANEPVTAVIGIKAKLYPVPSDEVINRLVVRNKDNNGFHNFLRAATREISFFKDFVFAVDKAKIDALSSSRRGSDSKIWKLLERRATKSKIRRSFGMYNDATAITSLCISTEEVETLKKEYNVDVSRIPIIKPIMDAYNLMGVMIIDSNIESVKFLYDDGSNKFETYSFNSLERESGDQNYKKVINLMSKMVR